MKYLVLFLSFFSIGLYGQGIEPTSLQPTPYKGGVMVGVIQTIDEFTGDTLYMYQHSDTVFTKIDSLVFTDSLRLYTSQGVYVTYIASGGVDSTNVIAGTGISVAQSPANTFNITNTGDLSNTNEIQQIQKSGSGDVNLQITGGGGVGIENTLTNVLVPSNGTNGQILTRGSGTNYSWQNKPTTSDSTSIIGGWGIDATESPSNTFNLIVDSTQVATQHDLTSKVGGSGVATRVAFWDSANSLSSNSNFFWESEKGLTSGNRPITDGSVINRGYYHGLTGTYFGSEYSSGAGLIGNFMEQNMSGDWRSTVNFGYPRSSLVVGVNNLRYITAPWQAVPNGDVLSVQPTEKFSIANDGIAKFSILAGFGDRMVVTNNNGEISQQAIPTGTVTSVSASSPLFSSGGTAPNLTIQTASGSQSGALTSTDWNTFNNKIGGSGVNERVTLWSGTNTTSSNSNLFFNTTRGLIAGTAENTSGSKIISGYYGSGSLVSTYYGAEYSSGAGLFGYFMDQNNSSDWRSTVDFNVPRSALIMSNDLKFISAPVQIVTKGNILTAQPTEKFSIANDGIAKFSILAGFGDRMVVTNNNGEISTQTIPTSTDQYLNPYIQGADTTGIFLTGAQDTVVFISGAASGEATTVGDTPTIDLTLTGVNITADVKNGSITPAKLDRAYAAVSLKATTTTYATSSTTQTEWTGGNFRDTIDVTGYYKVELYGTFISDATTTGGKYSLYNSSVTDAIGIMEIGITNNTGTATIQRKAYQNMTNESITGSAVFNTTDKHVLYGQLTAQFTSGDIIIPKFGSEIAASTVTYQAGTRLIITKLF